MKSTICAVALAAALALGACGGGGENRPITYSGTWSDTERIKGQTQAVHARADSILATALYDWLRGRTNNPQVLPQTRALRVDDIGPADRYRLASMHNGIPLAQSETTQKADLGEIHNHGYGGWLEHSLFWMNDAYFYRSDGTYVRTIASAFSFGDATGSAPGGGSATWTGAMVGRAFASLRPIRGNTTVRVDFAATDVDVSFTDIQNVIDRTALPAMHWRDLPIFRDGRFGGNGLEGAFYGPAHREVGGAFERGGPNGYLGAFGARRD